MYKNKTPKLGIPFMSKGEVLSEQSERMRAIIIENQLIAARKGVQNCVFDEGTYSIKDNTVVLSQQGRYAFEGIVSGWYCAVPDRIVWSGLKLGRINYLYLKAGMTTAMNTSHVQAISKDTTPYQKEHDVFLVAVLNKTGELDTHPEGKYYANDLLRHCIDNVNPHGNEIIQDSIVVKKIKSHDVCRAKVIKQQSGGKNGVILGIPEGVDVVSVDVIEECQDKPTFELGQVAVWIRDDSFTVFNDGKVGIPMMVTLWYRER